jgi:hypothetical protein
MLEKIGSTFLLVVFDEQIRACVNLRPAYCYGTFCRLLLANSATRLPYFHYRFFPTFIHLHTSVPVKFYAHFLPYVKGSREHCSLCSLAYAVVYCLFILFTYSAFDIWSCCKYFRYITFGLLRLALSCYYFILCTKKLDICSLMFVPCIARLSINNQHYALDYITPIFNMQDSKCFGSSLPSSGSFLDPCELLEKRNN